MLNERGIPVLVDMERTTQEMLRQGEFVPTADCRVALLNTTNRLNTYIGEHVGATISTAADSYAEYLTSNFSMVERNKALVGYNTAPENIPLNLSTEEHTEIQELSSRGFLSQEEAKGTFDHKLREMMRRNPKIVGLGASEGISQRLTEFANRLGGESMSRNETLKSDDIYMVSAVHSLDELGVYPGYADFIERGVRKDLSP